MDLPVKWWEKVGDQIEPRTNDKPGGFRLVRGATPPYGTLGVYQNASAKQAEGAKAKAEAELAEKALLASLPGRDDHVTIFTLDAERIMYSQSTVWFKFKNGEKIEETASSLAKGFASYDHFPPIRILLTDSGRFVTLDNRRLWCCKFAKTKIRCRWATDDEVTTEGFKFTSGHGIEGKASIKIDRPK